MRRLIILTCLLIFVLPRIETVDIGAVNFNEYWLLFQKIQTYIHIQMRDGQVVKSSAS